MRPTIISIHVRSHTLIVQKRKHWINFYKNYIFCFKCSQIHLLVMQEKTQHSVITTACAVLCFSSFYGGKK